MESCLDVKMKEQFGSKMALLLGQYREFTVEHAKQIVDSLHDPNTKALDQSLIPTNFGDLQPE